MKTIVAILSLWLSVAWLGAAEEFRTVDIFLDTQNTPLAAYQVEVHIAGAKIVGVEGGNHPALAEPPTYDPKALQSDKIKLAWVRQNLPAQLPGGKFRLCTLHVMVDSRAEKAVQVKLIAAGSPEAKRISAKISAVPEKFYEKK